MKKFDINQFRNIFEKELKVNDIRYEHLKIKKLNNNSIEISLLNLNKLLYKNYKVSEYKEKFKIYIGTNDESIDIYQNKTEQYITADFKIYLDSMIMLALKYKEVPHLIANNHFKKPVVSMKPVQNSYFFDIFPYKMKEYEPIKMYRSKFNQDTVVFNKSDDASRYIVTGIITTFSEENKEISYNEKGYSDFVDFLENWHIKDYKNTCLSKFIA